MMRALIAVVLVSCGLPAQADGVDVGAPSSVRNLVPAGAIEKQAAQDYEQLKRQAAAKRALGPDDHPQVKRLRAIAARMIPFADRFNPRARTWQWEVNLIGSRQINAFCMPGGKSATRLALTWNDRISFVLTEQLQIKRLVFLDLLKEDAERQAENADDLFAANFTLMCGELAQLLGHLLEVLGREGE